MNPFGMLFYSPVCFYCRNISVSFNPGKTNYKPQWICPNGRKWPWTTSFRVGKIQHFCLCLCASYLEIYNERVHDLLKKKPANGDGVLRVREHPLDGPYVESKTVFFCMEKKQNPRNGNRHALLCVQICLNVWFTTTLTWRILWPLAIPIAPQAPQPWITRAAALMPSLPLASPRWAALSISNIYPNHHV